MSEAVRPETGLLADAADGPVAGGMQGPAVAEAVAAAFTAAVASGRLDLPLPGRGQTRERWAVLADLAGEDLCVARLAEGHADALAILAELGAAAPPEGSRWGVWAAQPPGPRLTARQDRRRLAAGRHQAVLLRRAFVHRCGGDREGVPTGTGCSRSARAICGPFRAPGGPLGMAASDTLDVSFDSIEAEPVGGPGSYTGRPGFAHGGAGVAACWYGGARAVGGTLREAAAGRDVGPYALADLGAVDLALHTARTALDVAAAEIDADPADRQDGGWLRALRVRALIEAVATEVMRRVGRALGAGPLCRDGAHSRRVADLTVYLRQHHADRDLAQLGTLVASHGAAW